MRRKRLFLILGIWTCVILSAIVLAIAFWQPKHTHVLGEGKTYHIGADGSYYTKQCEKKGCLVKFETKISFIEALAIVTAEDKIVLEDDLVLTEEVNIRGFVGNDVETEAVVVNIDLDLNGHTLCTDVGDVKNNSMFMFNANDGEINFNVSNGKLYSQDLSYIFRFKNRNQINSNIKLNINNVESSVLGVKSTPLYLHNESSNIVVSATNSKFISKNSTKDAINYGVGAFINSDSQCNFTNCHFEGGDAVYVKRGTVNLTGCDLVVNDGLFDNVAQNVETFSAVGACLLADCHKTSDNEITKFEITIINCSMFNAKDFKMIYVVTTKASEELQTSVNEDCLIDVKSCTFNQNPTMSKVPVYNIVNYPNNQPPQNNGTQVWTCGIVE